MSRLTIRYLAAGLAAIMASIYALIGLGVLKVVDDVPVGSDMFSFGMGAGALFLVGAVLLTMTDRRLFWIVGAGGKAARVGRHSLSECAAETPCLYPSYFDIVTAMATTNRRLSDSAVHILVALGSAPKHGYAIASDVESMTEGHVRLGPGSLYTSLRRLLEDGLVEATERPEPGTDERRRYYRLTARGRAAVAAELEALSRVVEHAKAARLLPS